MLTKRLYRFDEVRAAFLYCLKQGRMKETLFWLEELEDSFYCGEVRRLLFLSWMMRVGLRCLAWLEAWSVDSETREGRWRLCRQLLWCKERDSSIWWLVWSTVLLGDKRLPEAPGMIFSKWLSCCTQEDEDFWQPLVDGSTDERIDSILGALQLDMKAYMVFSKAAAVVVVYGAKHVPKSTWLALNVPSMEDYMPISGASIRHQRLYSIPYDCLYGLTYRGAGGDTREELHQLTLKQLQTSAYWRRMIGSEQTDDQLELFWDTHFPWTICDHPDEWSTEDQTKSHGPGIPMGPLGRWWRNWVEPDHLFVWGTVHDTVRTWIQEQKTSELSVLDRLIDMYKGFTYTGPICNYPVTKEFLLS